MNTKSQVIDIDTMPVGPEMDALVAEKVMGWKRSKQTSHNYWEGRFEFLTSSDGYQIYRVENVGDWVGNTHESELYFRERCSYSTSISAAWEVVEKLRTPQSHGIVIAIGHNGFRVDIYKADDEWDAYADTLPLAICRAAWKAKLQ